LTVILSTRCILLSPETNPEKIKDSLRLIAERVRDREAFRKHIETNPLRRWLATRIQAIKDAQLDDIVIEDREKVYERFISTRKHLAPRHQRDFPRLLAFIKSHALLNFMTRKKIEGESRRIKANQTGIDAAFKLYNSIAEANELDLSPQMHQIYTEVLTRMLSKTELATRLQIQRAYFDRYGRHISDERIRRIPACSRVSRPDYSDAGSGR
jgi:hypothetical protein